jgi:DNA-binding LacI/PurR family transcriptional regulator
VLDMATTAVRMLIDRIEDKTDNALPQHLFATRLVVRESTPPVQEPNADKGRRADS